MPPKKPQPRKPAPPSTYRTRSVEEETAGKLYLVRDKDHGDGAPELWGKHLPYADACILKEMVVGSGKSRTARVEVEDTEHSVSPYLALAVSKRSPFYRADLTGAPTSADPEIAAAQRAALAAARPVAAAASTRMVTAAAATPTIVIPDAAMKPPEMPELPDELDGDIGEGDGSPLDPDELERLLATGDIPSAEDLEAAAAEVDGQGAPPVNLLELALTEPCPIPTCKAVPGAACTDPSGPITHPARIEAAAKAHA